MFPLLAGAITFVLLALYCRWIDDEWGDERAVDEPANGCRPSHQLNEEGRISIANWPMPKRRGEQENL